MRISRESGRGDPLGERSRSFGWVRPVQIGPVSPPRRVCAFLHERRGFLCVASRFWSLHFLLPCFAVRRLSKYLLSIQDVFDTGLESEEDTNKIVMVPALKKNGSRWS